jgi:uncharacterized protein (TIGR00297 family)
VPWWWRPSPGWRCSTSCAGKRVRREATEGFWGRVALGFAFSAIIGVLAYRSGALSRGGVTGAVLLGTVILGFAGWPWAIILVAFFVSSTVLSYYGRRRKAQLLGEVAKGHRRDLAQTLANAGIAGVLALWAGWTGPANPVYAILALAYVGGLAAVTADTWATELGVLAAQPPRLVTTGRRVSPGTSGAVTPEGMLAALAGACFIGVVGALLGPGAPLPSWLLWPPALGVISAPMWIGVATIAGLGGALFDSVLGATIQATYYCDACHKETERPVHSCGRETTLIRGWSRMDNDGVNALASAFGVMVGALLAIIVL